MPQKKDVDETVDQIGPATVHPIGRINEDGSMSLVIGGVEQTARRMAKWQASLLKELEAEGIDRATAAAIVSMTPEPKQAK